MKSVIITVMLLLIVGGCSDSYKSSPAITPPAEEQSNYFTVTLAWDDNNDPQVIGYAIYYRNDIADNYTWATSVNSDDKLTTTLNFDRSLATIWYFVVTAYSIDEESDYSNEVKYIA